MLQMTFSIVNIIQNTITFKYLNVRSTKSITSSKNENGETTNLKQFVFGINKGCVSAPVTYDEYQPYGHSIWGKDNGKFRMRFLE